MREAVTRPLGLRDVVIERDADQAARAAVGHDPKGNPTPDWRSRRSRAPERCTAPRTTSSTYLRAHLRLRPARMGAALRTVRTPRARVDARTRIGLAWFTSRLPGVGSFAWHNGISSGFTSFAAYVPGAGSAWSRCPIAARPSTPPGSRRCARSPRPRERMAPPADATLGVRHG